MTLRDNRSGRGGIVLAALVVLAFAVMCWPSTGSAGEPGQLQRLTGEELAGAWSRLDHKQRILALEQVAASGDVELVERLTAKGGLDGDREVQSRFYRAVALKRRGDHGEAVSEFRALLAERPDFARVRLELATSLYELKEDESSRHHFELVLAGSAADPDLERVVRSFTTAMDSRRRWEFSSYLTVAPSTNLNQGSEQKIVMINGLPFELDQTSLKKSGIGIVSGFQGGWRHPVADAIDFVVNAGAHSRRYSDRDFNDTIGSVSAGPRFRFGRGLLGVYGLAERRWFGDEDYSRSLGGMVSGSIDLTGREALAGDVACSRRVFDEHWRGSDIGYQDGYGCAGTLRFDHRIDTTSILKLIAGAGMERTGRAHLDNSSWNGGAGLYKEVPWGISLYAQAMFTNRQYDGVFPTMTDARHDKRLDVSLLVVKRDLVVFGFAPSVQYTYTHNVSNVDFYRFDAHGLGMTLTKKF